MLSVHGGFLLILNISILPCLGSWIVNRDVSKFDANVKVVLPATKKNDRGLYGNHIYIELMGFWIGELEALAQESAEE